MKKKCDICNGVLVTRELSHDGYDIFKCDSCSHRQLYPIPSVEEINDYYSTLDDTIGNANAFRNIHDYLGNKELFRRFNTRRLKQIFRFESLKNRELKFLEIGSGPGCFLAILKDFYGFRNLTGIDISGPIIDEGMRELGVQLYCHDAGEMEVYPNSPYDFIYSYHALEHTRNPSKIVCNIFNNLNIGGELFFSVPNFKGLLGTLSKERWYWILPPSHIHYFTKESVQKLLVRAGFQEYSIQTGIISTLGSLPADLIRLFRATVMGQRVGTLSKSILKTNYKTVLFADFLARVVFSPVLLYMYTCDTFDTINVYAKKTSRNSD